MANLTLKTLDDKLMVVGNTYKYRETFKEFGGIWDANRKAWIFHADLFVVLDDFIYSENKIKVKKERLCGICREPGHTRVNCNITCDYCKVPHDHYEKDCRQKERHTLILKDPKYKRFYLDNPQNRCYCSLSSGVCSYCKYMCCNDAKIINCVGICCFKCDTHNIQSCNGSHE